MIDTTPQVGRIVVRVNDEPESWLDREWTGRITAINGKQLTFDRRLEQRFESRKMLVWKVAAVCDTEAELETLFAIDNEVTIHYWDYLGKRKDIINKAFGGSQ